MIILDDQPYIKTRSGSVLFDTVRITNNGAQTLLRSLSLNETELMIIFLCGKLLLPRELKREATVRRSARQSRLRCFRFSDPWRIKGGT